MASPATKGVKRFNKYSEDGQDNVVVTISTGSTTRTEAYTWDGSAFVRTHEVQ
ncbi:hypothetical protein [Fodinicola acaciae]|uniref:hypothetical protein n=1 Tax=Fodinicola acaciae TaxID=2681555 RepID=UPI0013D74DAD|nr:hypothetical protein [Fodinicola acaciae]